ncbi:MAG: hypothetical protein UV29_C0005G0002 [Candidatus Collierbacteria bacterium GW2011_GWD2_42_50]|nr:MAG: hypothetical protein UV29_C0005G0002 [Candidatus Collierbacteria bacterium GW2011_GWD2_42_50]
MVLLNIASIFIGLLLLLFWGKLRSFVFAPRQAIPTNETKLTFEQSSLQNIEVITQKLNIPWEITFLQSGDLLVTERSGKLLKIGSETKVIKEIEGVRHVGEGGLLGLTLHPNFSVNNFIYLYSTTEYLTGSKDIAFQTIL